MAEKKGIKTRVFVPGARNCPKCGAGVHLAAHADRFSCGRCGYMEMREKTAAATSAAQASA